MKIYSRFLVTSSNHANREIHIGEHLDAILPESSYKSRLVVCKQTSNYPITLISTYSGEPISSITIADRNEMLDILIQLLEILKLLRVAGVLHRDLTRDNILIQNGTISVIDFGVSLILCEQHSCCYCCGFMRPAPVGMFIRKHRRPPESRMFHPYDTTEPFAIDMWQVGDSLTRTFHKPSQDIAIIIKQMMAANPKDRPDPNDLLNSVRLLVN